MRGIDPTSTLHLVLATVPEPLPISPLAGPKCAGLLSAVSSSSEKPSKVSSDSGNRELSNAPVSIASGFPDEGLGVPWLVNGVGWEDVPAGSDWEGVPVVASPVKEMDP